VVTVRRAFLNPLWILLLLPGYVSWRLLPALSIGPVGICAGIALLIAFGIVMPLWVRNRAIRNPTVKDLLAWAGVLSMGFFSSLFVFTLLRDIVLLIAHWSLSAPMAASWAAPSARWTLALTVLVTVAGLLVARSSEVIIVV
jgi:hypothetical protein